MHSCFDAKFMELLDEVFNDLECCVKYASMCPRGFTRILNHERINFYPRPWDAGSLNFPLKRMCRNIPVHQHISQWPFLYRGFKGRLRGKHASTDQLINGVNGQRV